jgi:hypothetical protein
MNKYPIYVISKGRYNNCLTVRELNLMGADFYLVVEPQELEAYSAVHHKILVLPFTNLGQGSIPARNWVWNHSLSNGDFRHWIVDDNIEGFHRLNRNEKPKLLSPVFFKVMEDFVDRYKNIAIAGPNYYSFCKTTDRLPPYYLNTRIYSCILIRNDTGYMWRGRYNEDTDLSLRALKDGWCTVLFNAFLIGKVTTMRMKGGNTDEVYADTDNRREFAESLRDQHPELVTVTWKFNRWHHQVNYKPFKKNTMQLMDGILIKEGINEYGMIIKC